MGFRNPAEKYECLVQPVVHVQKRLIIEGTNGWIDPVVDRFRRLEVACLHRAEERNLQIGDHATGTGQQPVTAEHERPEQRSQG